MPRRRRRHLSRSWLIFPVMVLAVMIGICAALAAPSWARSKLENSGYRDITMTGTKPFAPYCDDNNWAQGFAARGPRGDYRSGYVCVGFVTYIVD